jgi:DNA replication and repair protein RecF
VLVTGANGAGKTNLLEALHVGTQGFSPRSRSDAQLVRFGDPAARIRLTGTRSGGVPLQVEVVLRPGSGKQGTLNGARLRAAEQLRGEVATLVFTPDRLVVVKGGPAARRAYLDRALGRMLPARAGLAAAYGAALGQRNASLRRVALGLSSREALEPWTERVVALGRELAAAREEALTAIAGPFAERAAELGLEEAALEYAGDPLDHEVLAARLERDVERGTTGAGPHLHDVAIRAGTRELRLYGSQGQQRLAVLALLLAEADVLTDRRGEPPLLLLDDVLSELDAERREVLLKRLPPGSQTVVTATSAALSPRSPEQLLEVSGGEASTVRRVA